MPAWMGEYRNVLRGFSRAGMWKTRFGKMEEFGKIVGGINYLTFKV